MATFIIPTRQDLGNYEFEVALDDVTFRIRLKYNSRDESWFMTLFDSTGVELRSGIKLVSDWAPLRLYQDTNSRPEGEVMTINVSGDDLAKPGLEQLGIETLLAYEGDS